MARLGRWFLPAAGACALFLSAYAIDRALQEGDLGSTSLAGLGGVWRARGYGWLWQIADGRVRVFDESGSYCIARPDMRQRLKSLQGRELDADGRQLRVSFGDPAYRYTFDRIDTLPAACTRPVDESPAGVLAALDAVFSAHYAFFEQRNVDWSALVAKARGKLTADVTEAELLAVLGSLLSQIDDDHVTLEAKVDGRRLSCDPGQARVLRPGAGVTCERAGEAEARVSGLQKAVWAGQAADGLLGDSARIAGNGSIKYGLIGGDVGYLGLLAMDDFDAIGDDELGALEAALDDAIALFQGARTVIVDVSLNNGGEDRLARAIAARFAPEPALAYSKFAGDAPGDAPQAIFVTPSARARYTGPVYLLTSNVTVSAAEIFAMTMRALPNVTHAGEATRGSLSDMLVKRLPNDWSVTLSNEIYLDKDGVLWEGKGIPPELPLPVFAPGADPAATHARALRALVARVG